MAAPPNNNTRSNMMKRDDYKGPSLLASTSDSFTKKSREKQSTLQRDSTTTAREPVAATRRSPSNQPPRATKMTNPALAHYKKRHISRTSSHQRSRTSRRGLEEDTDDASVAPPQAPTKHTEQRQRKVSFSSSLTSSSQFHTSEPSNMAVYDHLRIHEESSGSHSSSDGSHGRRHHTNRRRVHNNSGSTFSPHIPPTSTQAGPIVIPIAYGQYIDDDESTPDATHTAAPHSPTTSTSTQKAVYDERSIAAQSQDAQQSKLNYCNHSNTSLQDVAISEEEYMEEWSTMSLADPDDQATIATSRTNYSLSGEPASSRQTGGYVVPHRLSHNTSNPSSRLYQKRQQDDDDGTVTTANYSVGVERMNSAVARVEETNELTKSSNSQRQLRKTSNQSLSRLSQRHVSPTRHARNASNQRHDTNVRPLSPTTSTAVSVGAATNDAVVYQQHDATDLSSMEHSPDPEVGSSSQLTITESSPKEPWMSQKCVMVAELLVIVALCGVIVGVVIATR